MANDDTRPRDERRQTDASLQHERSWADAALDDKLTALDEAADAVIVRARARADAVVAAARARTDAESGAPIAHSTIYEERRKEDKAVRMEREAADVTLRQERGERANLLTSERGETDRSLSSERARADDVVAIRDEFLAIVSHDLRNMLSTMVNLSAVIAAPGASNRPEYARRIQRLAGRMGRLIGDLVDVGSIHANRLAVSPELSDPAAVVAEIVESFQNQASEAGISLTSDIANPAATGVFDPARVLQVLTNLVCNALKFTPKGGGIVVRVERTGDDLVFSVRDTGSGIPGNKLETIFERFLQVRENDRRGLGLGLYISKCIVHGHGGRIWAESAVGKGSTFIFTVPARPPQ